MTDSRVMQGFPNFVQEPMVADQQLNPGWSNWFQQSITYMQNNFSQEGLVPPQLTTQQITDILAGDNAKAQPKLRGALWYDTTTNQLKFNKNGVATVIA